MIAGDVLIIGAGVVGCALARQLSRYDLKILLLEAADDVGTGASKANSGIVHGGYTAKAGTLKGDLCIKGNRMFESLDDELHFGFRRTGSVVLAFNEKDLKTINELKSNGIKNGVKGLDILSSEKTLSLYPNLNPDLIAALYCPETGIVSPYEYCIALAENAVENGVNLCLDSRVQSIRKEDGRFIVHSDKDTFTAEYVVNASGVSSASVAAMACTPGFSIKPRKGQYLLMRRGSAEALDVVVFQTPGEKGKGILVTPTVWGNLLIGPNAEDVADPDDLGTDPEALAEILKTARKSLPALDPKKAIRFFSGIRPRGDRGDFIIEESSVEGFFNLGGIESPGLTSSPAIALKMEELLMQRGLKLVKKRDFNPYRKAICSPGPLGDISEASEETKREYGDPSRVVCRCEQVKESVIRDSLNRGIPIRSSDAVKRRTRAGMGACQGQFCGPRVEEYIIRERGIEIQDLLPVSRSNKKIRKTVLKIVEILENKT